MKKKLLWIWILAIIIIVWIFSFFYFRKENVSKTWIENQFEIKNQSGIVNLVFEYTKKLDCYDKNWKKQENYSYDKNNNVINCYDKNEKKLEYGMSLLFDLRLLWRIKIERKVGQQLYMLEI